MTEHIFPAEDEFWEHQESELKWTPHPHMEEMKVTVCAPVLILFQLSLFHSSVIIFILGAFIALIEIPFQYHCPYLIPLPILMLSSQAKAQELGLWNLFLPLEADPKTQYGAGLTNLEYAHLAEIMGQSVFASEVG